MKKKTNFIVYLIILTVIGIPLLVWLYHHLGVEQVFSYIKELETYQLLIILFLSFLNLLFWTWRWKIILDQIKIKKVSLMTTIKARMGNVAVNYVTPAATYGGELVRPIVLKKEGNIPLTQGITSVLIDRVIEGLVFGVFCLLGAIILFSKGVLAWAILLLVAALALLGGLFFVLKKKAVVRILNWLSKLSFFRNFSSDLSQKMKDIGVIFTDFFHEHSKTFWTSIMLTVAYILAASLQVELFLYFLGEQVFFHQALAIRMLGFFGNLIPVPASIGFYEGAYVVGFLALGFSAQLGLGFSFICRFADFILVSLGIILLLPYLGEVFGLLFKSINNGNHFSRKNKEKIS